MEYDQDTSTAQHDLTNYIINFSFLARRLISGDRFTAVFTPHA